MNLLRVLLWAFGRSVGHLDHYRGLGVRLFGNWGWLVSIILYVLQRRYLFGYDCFLRVVYLNGNRSQFDIDEFLVNVQTYLTYNQYMACRFWACHSSLADGECSSQSPWPIPCPLTLFPYWSPRWPVEGRPTPRWLVIAEVESCKRCLILAVIWRKYRSVWGTVSCGTDWPRAFSEPNSGLTLLNKIYYQPWPFCYWFGLKLLYLIGSLFYSNCFWLLINIFCRIVCKNIDPWSIQIFIQIFTGNAILIKQKLSWLLQFYF